ncbi:MAG: hypothetical protein ACK5RN_04410 [bacterium]|jgi:hypothetical protein
MEQRIVRPPFWRLALAFIVVPGAAALAMAIQQPLYAGLPDFWDRVFRTALINAVVGAYPAALVLGVPAYLLFKKRLRPTVLNCAAVGAVIAALPWLLLGLLSSPDYAYSNGHVTHQNGHITLWGLFDLAVFTGWIGLLGAGAGVLFWLITVPGAPRTALRARLET